MGGEQNRELSTTVTASRALSHARHFLKCGRGTAKRGNDSRSGAHTIIDLIAASIHDEYSVGPSIRRICTRCWFTMTSMIQVCSEFHWARVFIINTCPVEIVYPRSERLVVVSSSSLSVVLESERSSLSLSLSPYLSIYLSISIYLSLYLPIHLSLCLLSL